MLPLTLAQHDVGCSMSTGTPFEGERGHQHSSLRKMRFNKAAISKLSKLCYRSKHKHGEKLLEQAANFDAASTSDQSKFLHKISLLLEDCHLDDLLNVTTRKGEKVAGSFDVSSVSDKFPSITVGSSPKVELYSESFWHSQIEKYSAAQSCEEIQPILSDEAQQCGLSVSEEPSFPVVLEHDQRVELTLDKPISCMEGLSKRHSRQLEDCEIHTLRKLLHHFPRTYADLHNSHFGIEDGQYIIFVGKVLSSRAVKASFSLSFHEVIVRGEVVDQMAEAEVDPDGSNGGWKRQIYLHLKKFLRGTRFTNQGFLKILENKHKEGDIVCASGKVKITSKEGHYEMRAYSLDVIENEGESSLSMKGGPYPIYPSKGGLKPQFFKDIIARALQSLQPNIDPIPRDITRDIGLLSLNEAYIGIHQPKDVKIAQLARKRFIFDEFFYLQLGRLYQMLDGLGSRIEKEGLIDKYRNIDQSSILAEDWCDLTRRFLEGLPYSLTKSQLNAVSEIIWDLKRPVPMNRLLQGDVGCGKTVVAFLACMEVIGAGYQAAYMVPTELLAIQHYNDFISLLENVDPDKRLSVALLTGSTPTRQGRMIRNDLLSGTISVVIGTHSLIAESVRFSALRLAVIDEQHRFGVIQRGRFNSKLWYASAMLGVEEAAPNGTSKAETLMAPHVLAMSATPIPRSLALALYGDMSLTQITDLPPGRLPIETKIVEGNQKGFEKVYEMMHYELETGGKVYIVYPIIEQSEQLPKLRAASGDFEAVCSRFSTYKCGLLHGRMKGGEKDKALKDFRAGETQILLATQVIEIGVDVPDASMMVVMNAERFGIAQLHQLRGRVGRGSRKSKCILVASTASSVGRLSVLEHSSDGFSLAKVDLLLRGPGDLLGKKQSGHLPEFPIARLEIDGTIIQDAHVAALRILSASYDLDKYPELKAELSMRQPLSLLGD
ncbi:hypothetical protein RND81_11G074200 [Saponaria officinalis]|uniref:DNA 3'-5' helicase n=1 Tax=Saponaria officinalis TaxID=3572 RepID=A0AAW1HI23_SAPOF